MDRRNAMVLFVVLAALLVAAWFFLRDEGSSPHPPPDDGHGVRSYPGDSTRAADAASPTADAAAAQRLTERLLGEACSIGEARRIAGSAETVFHQIFQPAFIPGVVPLLYDLRGRGYHLGLATGSTQSLVDASLHAIGADLRARFERTLGAVLEASGQRELLARNPVLARSIRVRNPYVDPINLLQIEALRRHRADPDDP